MKITKEIIEKAEEFALSEIKKYGGPPAFLCKEASKHGLEIAEKLSVNEDLVSIGAWLMDVKLPQAIKEGRRNEHIVMSVQATKSFLDQFDLDQDTKDKIVNCVEGHHGTIEWTCKEAEVVANADCYKFLIVRTWLRFLQFLASRGGSFDEQLKYAEEKANEKWNILSLDICKKELQPHYKLIKEIISKAKELK